MAEFISAHTNNSIHMNNIVCLNAFVKLMKSEEETKIDKYRVVVNNNLNTHIEQLFHVYWGISVYICSIEPLVFKNSD